MQQPQLHSVWDHVRNDDEREEMRYSTVNKRRGTVNVWDTEFACLICKHLK